MEDWAPGVGRLGYHSCIGGMPGLPRPRPADVPDLLLSVEPDNMQAQSLRQQIDKAVQRDGYIGVGILAGGAAVTGIILASIWKRASRR